MGQEEGTATLKRDGWNCIDSLALLRLADVLARVQGSGWNALGKGASVLTSAGNILLTWLGFACVLVVVFCCIVVF